MTDFVIITIFISHKFKSIIVFIQVRFTAKINKKWNKIIIKKNKKQNHEAILLEIAQIIKFISYDKYPYFLFAHKKYKYLMAFKKKCSTFSAS